MKKGVSFSVLCCVLYVTCFMISACVFHDVEAPAPPADHGKADSTETDLVNPFKNEVANAIKKLDPCHLYDSSIPVREIWNNIAYESSNYEKFFYSFCPQTAQSVSGNELRCDYTSPESEKKFRIIKFPTGVMADIQMIRKDGAAFSAVWGITETKTGPIITKHERLFKDNLTSYRRLITRSSLADGARKIIASGEAGTFCSYSFDTGELRFSDCANVPTGTVLISGANDATVYFYGAPACKDCAPAKIGENYGKFDFCGPWELTDLFDDLISNF